MRNFVFAAAMMIAAASTANAQETFQLPIAAGSSKTIKADFPVNVTFPATYYCVIDLLGKEVKTTDYSQLIVKLSQPVTSGLVIILNDQQDGRKDVNINGDVATIDLAAYAKEAKKLKNIRLFSPAPATDVSYTVNEAYLVKSNGSKEVLNPSNVNAKSMTFASATFLLPTKGWESVFQYTLDEHVNKIKEYDHMKVEFAGPTKVNLTVEFDKTVDGKITVVGYTVIPAGASKATVDMPMDKSYEFVKLLHYDDPAGQDQVITVKSVTLTR